MNCNRWELQNVGFDRQRTRSTFKFPLKSSATFLACSLFVRRPNRSKLSFEILNTRYTYSKQCYSCTESRKLFDYSRTMYCVRYTRKHFEIWLLRNSITMITLITFQIDLKMSVHRTTRHLTRTREQDAIERGKMREDREVKFVYSRLELLTIRENLVRKFIKYNWTWPISLIGLDRNK